MPIPLGKTGGFCEHLDMEIEGEAGAAAKYGELKRAVKRQCPAGYADICEAIIESIQDDEKKHNKMLKAVREICCKT